MEIFVIRDGDQTGPFDEGAVRTLLSEGGVRPQDLAWRKGLPRWLPLSEVLDSHSAGTVDPPVLPSAENGFGENVSSRRREPATAKQKAFLKYLGAEFDEGIGKEKAALAISDALENPKTQARIRKWQDEKLRLHPDVFQDEIDLRKANRASRYLELVQTEGAEALKDVTKAHVQVIVESLDKRHPSWEGQPRAALWDFLVPSLGEHFPQLVQPAYKGRLRVGGTLTAAEPAAGSLAGGTRSLIPPPAAPGTLAAMWRGVFYGVIALGAIVGGIRLWQQWHVPPAKTDTSAPGATEAPKADAAVAASEPAVQPAEEPVAEAKPATPPPEEPAAPEPPKPAASDATPAMAPEKPALAEEKPAASAPAMAPAEPAAAPPAPEVAPPPAAPVVPRTQVTLVQGIGIPLPNGQVNLPAGTRLRYLALEGPNVRVAWNNNVFYVPAIATDVGNGPAASPPAAAPAPAPAAPEPGKKPADDL